MVNKIMYLSAHGYHPAAVAALIIGQQTSQQHSNNIICLQNKSIA